jgi:NAD(P)-dependent dehydrogenase (short-subunit alcohol dehydrogenase family)
VLAGDVSDFSLAKKAVELAIGRWGRLDALVVNHGGLDPVKKVADSTPEEWRSAFDVNVFSAVGLVSYFPLLIRLFSRALYMMNVPEGLRTH